MELELKHLAPYLPYNLKVMVDDGAADEVIIIYPKDLGFQTSRAFFGNINEIKPILRSLNTIMDDEQAELEKIIGRGFYININSSQDIEIEENSSDPWDGKQVLRLSVLSKVYEYLFSKHFDVFNLIEQGLAIEG